MLGYVWMEEFGGGGRRGLVLISKFRE